MSDPSAAWISIDVSGPMNSSRPSTYERKRTPSSSIERILLSRSPRRRLISSATEPCPIEKTWNPPESVTMGRRQPMNSWRPPIRRISSCPGCRKRWNVLPSTISYPSASTSAACSDLTVAVDASGTNAGVCTAPCVKRRTPARAFPARASISNGPAVTRGSVAPAAAAASTCSALRALGRGSLDGGRTAIAVLGRADLHPARLALLRLRDPHLEDALVELGAHPLRVDAVGQRQRAAEPAGGALHAIPASLLLLVLRAALARDRQGVVPDLDRHVVLAEPREVGLEDEVIVRLDQVHRRHPALGVGVALVEKGVEEAVDLVRERLWLHQEGHLPHLLERLILLTTRS